MILKIHEWRTIILTDKLQLKPNPFSFSPFGEMTGILGVTLLLTLLHQPVLAQFTPESNTAPPLDRPSYKTSEESSPVLELPPLPDLPVIPQDQQLLSSLPRLEVKQFLFEGNTVFSTQQLEQITQDYLREITAEELQEVKNQITALYIKAGYVNSGAIIPDQPVTDGTVTIKIIEGKLVRVEVSNNQKLRTSYIEKRLKNHEGEALDINRLQERLQILQQNPRLTRIQAELGPGVKLGEGILNVKVDEAKPYEFGFKFNNYRSPSVGAYRGEITGQHRNVTGIFGEKLGFGDTFYARFGLTEGLKDYSFRYELPLNHYETSLSFLVERSDSDVVESPFNQLDVESEADTYAVIFKQPVPWLRTPGRSLDFSLRFEKRASKTFLLGRPFSFSPGVQNGESKLTVLRFSQDYLDRSSYDVIAGRSSFNFGLDALDSTINEDGTPDSKFFSWLGQFQYVRRFDLTERFKNSEFIFRFDTQLANESLLPLEKLSIGGATTVRGYRENYLTRDNGLISSMEMRIPIFKMPIPGLSKNPEDGQISIAPFIDYGRAWNDSSDVNDFDDDIVSTGVGLRWLPNRYIHAQVYWGKALTDVEEQEDKDLQDDGVHFEISVRYPFD
jgi:hemolysin activation/secretion protein